MLRPPKAAAPLRRRCLSCFDRFTGGMSAPLPPPESPRTLPGPFPGPGRSLADDPSPTPTGNRCFRGRYNRRADRNGLAEAIRPNRPGRIRVSPGKTACRPLQPRQPPVPLQSIHIFNNGFSSCHQASSPAARPDPPLTSAISGAGIVAFFHKNRCGTSPREIGPPAPFSRGFSFSEQNAGGYSKRSLWHDFFTS